MRNKLETREDGLYINGKKVIKGWESMSGWYWFATEIEMEDYQGYPIWFGFVQGFEDEWGSFTQIELENQPSIWEIKEVDLPHAGRRN
tara:strand:- start:189 stop:452 length:264 start_codon:yes stop_codon:yes gene_type:complete